MMGRKPLWWNEVDIFLHFGNDWSSVVFKRSELPAENLGFQIRPEGQAVLIAASDRKSQSSAFLGSPCER